MEILDKEANWTAEQLNWPTSTTHCKAPSGPATIARR